ncbi:toxin-antitoxin system protein [Bifidobacterium tibiigranuli]|uniref:toxin-antitoxin system protein n=1 Tax=Bifidobacterium tibiigranuli TaxID=2172043 RepID=UPI00235715DB|nr:toxin-antitoxin system protein [Bifidobacterium tibiigranuli]MCH3975974.1 toxin-antitoxin system protein [Bifidobacterium tibiigranuli]MCI2184842.1 toxin-antitoxin system protein [Bifidobacterium tibiigranuli]MCI2204367.1 toxin-antitoxin system protein [Bifidobacterium tibiigranuli]
MTGTMGKDDEMGDIDYEELMARAERGADRPPLASFSGDDAARVVELMDGDADTFYRTVLGRPTLGEQRRGRERSVQRALRMPESLDDYASKAAKRDGLDNFSEYVRRLIERDAVAHRHDLAAA